MKSLSDKPIRSEEAVELEVRLKTEKKDVLGDQFAGNEQEDHQDFPAADLKHKPNLEDEKEKEREEESSELVSSELDIEDELFRQFEYLLGDSVLVVTETQQLNLLGQTFRPIFCGTVCEVEIGHITLYPVTIKLLNAPFHQSPFPLSIPFEKIAHFTPNFDCGMRFPLV